MRINVYLFIFIFIFHTDWKETRHSSKDMNEFWGVYAQTNFGTHTQTISQEILELSSKQEKSRHSGSPVPDLDHKSNIHLTLGVEGQGLGYGTTVTTFQSTTPAPSLWIGSSMSAVPDKETAVLAQEVSHNHPDASGTAPGVLYISTSSLGRSMPESSGQRQISVVPGQTVSEHLVADVKSEVSLLLKSSTPSPTLSSVSVPFTQSLGSHLQTAVSGADSRHAGAPLLSTVGLLEASSSRMLSAITATSPGSLPDALSQQSDSYDTPTDLPGGKCHVDMSIIPSSITSFRSEDGPVEFDTQSVSPTSGILPTASDAFAEHSLITVPAGLSQEPSGEPATGPGALLGRDSRNVTHKGSPLGSVLEDTTNMGLGLSHMTAVGATGEIELNTIDEASHPDVPLFSSTERLNAENVTSERIGDTMQSRHPDSQFTTTNTYVGLDDQGAHDITDSNTFHFQQETTDVSNADLHPSDPHTNPQQSSAQSHSTASHRGTQPNGNSSIYSTVSGLEELTTMVSMSPVLTQRTSVSQNLDGRTFTSSKGDSENENTSPEHTTREYSQRVTPVHTLTVSSTESEKIPLSRRDGTSTSVDPPTSSTLKVSSPNFLSPGSLPVNPMAPERLSPSVQSGVTPYCHNCVTNPLVTTNSTVSTSERAIRHGPVKSTAAPPSTSPPKTAPEALGNPLATEGAVAMGPSSVHTTVSRPGTTLQSSAQTVKQRIFIVEDQPAIIKEETAQLLLQVVLASGPLGDEEDHHLRDLEEDTVTELHPFLQRAPGFQALQLSWTSTSAVVQSVATFDTRRALPWLGVAGAPLLQVTGLSDAMMKGLYVNSARVQKITVGGLQSDPCSWLFLCPPGFRCVPAHSGNASCTSLCHAGYCKNDGICSHHHGEAPTCQCPVGEDFWFMGRQCDSQMTRQRLVGVCIGVLIAVALLMAAVSFLVIRHFKAMLVQAKVDQTRSSYRRFNHFDELSGRFWLRSWPGSADSLDNPVFSHSDELLHLRALDQTCCYHDDTLSIVSTFPGSEAQLNTIYAHGSQYNWDVSGSSINDFMADSGKASDISVCSWPVEPIQWTPFPLLQQLGIQRPTKTSRPRSYCEGMELVDMEKTWTEHHHS
ncbi:uncharacterized protein [Paramormyrops kingsleyae]|uniref:uncharacterized protein isoform X1 n=1 Tax=Paramormyrops kingsleyae TaxID=1676925 RepID=UPI003B9729D2